MQPEDYATNVAITRYLRSLGMLDSQSGYVPEYAANLTVYEPEPDYYGAESVERLARLIWRLTGDMPGPDRQGYLREFARAQGIQPFYPPEPFWNRRQKKRGLRKDTK